jgi:hypothetical protein
MWRITIAACGVLVIHENLLIHIEEKDEKTQAGASHTQGVLSIEHG